MSLIGKRVLFKLFIVQILPNLRIHSFQENTNEFLNLLPNYVQEFYAHFLPKCFVYKSLSVPHLNPSISTYRFNSSPVELYRFPCTCLNKSQEFSNSIGAQHPTVINKRTQNAFIISRRNTKCCFEYNLSLNKLLNAM